MEYRLNARAAHQDFLRARSSDKGYVERLVERDEVLYIGNVAVDVPNMIFRRFCCDTRICVRKGRKNGRNWYTGSCCTDLVVEVSEPEQNQLETLAEKYLKRFPEGPRGLVTAARKVVKNDIIIYTKKDEPILDDCRSNRCGLSFLDGNGVLRCAVHAMALALKEPVEKWKLDACICYPIHYVDYEPGRWLLTVVCKENFKMLGAAKEAATMPCLAKPPKDAPRAYVFLRRELEHLWGREFWKELDYQARRLLA